MGHYPSIYVGYSAALLGWLVAWRLWPVLWPKADPPAFEHPWREVGYAFVAGLGILAVGQLYAHGIRLPADGRAGPLLEAMNQIVIFSPMIVLLPVRGQTLETAWVKTDRVGVRLIVGFSLALAALLAYTLSRRDAAPFWGVVRRVFAYENLGLAVQVFLEDITIAILVVRFAAAMGTRLTIVMVAVLFAAGHIPAMLTRGAALPELVWLSADAALGVFIIAVALRSRDIWWLWFVHFSMDMTQFERIAGVGS